MKIAEALQERADLNRKIAQLRQRMTKNVLVQEGELPSEDVEQLRNELNGSLDRLARLITRINLTNAAVVLKGKTLTEWIAEKDTLTLRIAVYKEVIDSAGNVYYRARRSEIKILSVISVRDWQKEIDHISADLRKIDNMLQETNWSTKLIE